MHIHHKSEYCTSLVRSVIHIPVETPKLDSSLHGLIQIEHLYLGEGMSLVRNQKDSKCVLKVVLLCISKTFANNT